MLPHLHENRQSPTPRRSLIIFREPGKEEIIGKGVKILMEMKMANQGNNNYQGQQGRSNVKNPAVLGGSKPGYGDDNDREFIQNTPHEYEDERSANQKGGMNQDMDKTGKKDLNRDQDTQKKMDDRGPVKKDKNRQ
jgi:hypothetical protein